MNLDVKRKSWRLIEEAHVRGNNNIKSTMNQEGENGDKRLLQF